MNPENLKSGDTDELEALFDEIASKNAWADTKPSAAEKPVEVVAPESSAEAIESAEADWSDASQGGPIDDPHDVFRRVGNLTRKLHDALRELGYDKNVESAVNSLPDARARLAYIADLTGKAAEKVLASVEAGQKLNDDLSDKAKALNTRWEQLYRNELSLEEFKQLANDSKAFMSHVGNASGDIGSRLTDIMMAQDFHDLTGQVVNRIAIMAQNLEQQLVQLLLDTTPPDQRKQVEDAWLTGPAMNAEGRNDVCSNQGQVDDLLESLGF